MSGVQSVIMYPEKGRLVSRYLTHTSTHSDTFTHKDEPTRESWQKSRRWQRFTLCEMLRITTDVHSRTHSRVPKHAHTHMPRVEIYVVGGVGTITRTPCSAAFNARGTDK